jgi:predicted anti-sigma-YlaC factor YlaD
MFRHKLTVTLICLLSLQACAVKQFAISKLGDTLAEGDSVYASDNDIEFVGDALPFTLKTIEGLLTEVPKHEGLLLTAASGFTQYSYVYVDFEAFKIEQTDPQKAYALKQRAKNLYLRGHAYALRSIELKQENFIAGLRTNPVEALSVFSSQDVPILYWFSLSWAAAIAADKSDMEMLADLNLIEPVIRRCLELDESFEHGALHEFLIAYQGGRSILQGGGSGKARQHFERAMALAANTSISPLVSLAESVSISEQNLYEFETVLNLALSYNVDAHMQTRLANLVAQRRARLLLTRTEAYFLEDYSDVN